MPLRKTPEPIDLDANLSRLETERHDADTALTALIDDRRVAVLDGSPETIVEIDNRQSLELARVEQLDAQIAVARKRIAERDAETAAADRIRAYEAAKEARADGVDALATANRLLGELATVRARLIRAKATVAEANRALPPGCAPLVDPEGERVAAGWPSILDQVRFSTTAATWSPERPSS